MGHEEKDFEFFSVWIAESTFDGLRESTGLLERMSKMQLAATSKTPRTGQKKGGGTVPPPLLPRGQIAIKSTMP
jgi:hypothetical protein